MKYYWLGFLILVLLIPSVGFAESLADQICVGNPLTEGSPVTYQSTLHGQVFTPTLNHIGKVAIFGKSVGGTSAKVKLKIQKAWYSFNGMPTYEKTIVLNDSPWWSEADFGEAPVTPGVAYFLTAEPLNGAMVSWYITENSDCNPGGYAFVEGNSDRTKDFYFSVRGFSETIQLENPAAIDENVSTQPSDPAATTASPLSQDQIITQESRTNTNSDSSQSNTTGTAGSATKKIISDDELAGANKVSKSSGSLSEEEIDDILKMIAEDYERNHKTGMFGLSGMAGRILTPTVFYGFLGLIIIFIIGFVLLMRKLTQRT